MPSVLAYVKSIRFSSLVFDKRFAKITEPSNEFRLWFSNLNTETEVKGANLIGLLIRIRLEWKINTLLVNKPIRKSF